MTRAAARPGWQPTSRRGFAVVAAVIRPLLVLLTVRRRFGTEHIPPAGGVIVAVNHISVVDPLLIGHVLYDSGRIPRFMGKSELFGWPLVGRIMRITGQIPVYRNSPDAALALRDAVRALAAGECVVIYPEGTVTRDPRTWPVPARSGVARLARLSGAPVLPVAQWGAQQILPRGGRLRLLPRRTIAVLVGPPVDLGPAGDEGTTMASLSADTAIVMAAITGQLETLRGERLPGTVSGVTPMTGAP